MNKQPLNYIFINPNDSEDKKKCFQEKVIKVLAISTCKKFMEEMEKSKMVNSETEAEADANSVKDN